MNTGPDQHRDAGGDQPKGNHGQQHDARGGDGQRDEEVADERRHVEEQRLLQRQIQLVQPVAEALDLGDFQLAGQEDRLVREELREADPDARNRARGST